MRHRTVTPRDNRPWGEFCIWQATSSRNSSIREGGITESEDRIGPFAMSMTGLGTFLQEGMGPASAPQQ